MWGRACCWELGFGNIGNDRSSIADSAARGQGGARIGVVAMPRSPGGGCQCTRGHCATELIINFWVGWSPVAYFVAKWRRGSGIGATKMSKRTGDGWRWHWVWLRCWRHDKYALARTREGWVITIVDMLEGREQELIEWCAVTTRKLEKSN
jgi:hypothetical protein